MRRLSFGIALASLLSMTLVPNASAHSGVEVGEYLLTIGWKNEPAFVGQPNAVQVTILNHADESPVLDLEAEALAVVVSTAGQDSPALALTAAFDAQERTGPLGEYNAALVPTAPGDYTFHVTGSIRGTAVDLEMASGDETFEPVQGSSDLEFPAKLPNLSEVATRLDRIDDRIAALQSTDPDTSAMNAARVAADRAVEATDAANRALFVGSLIGGAGILVAVIALFVAIRAGRRGAGTA